MAMMLPSAGHAQTGKHIAIGASVASHDYTNQRFRQGIGISLLYRVAPNGNEENGLSWGPSATIGFSRAGTSRSENSSRFRLWSASDLTTRTANGGRGSR